MKRGKNDFVLGKNDFGNAFSKIKKGKTNLVLGKNELGKGDSSDLCNYFKNIEYKIVLILVNYSVR